MKSNIGKIERIIRITAGIIITTFAFMGPQNPWFFLGLIPLATGLSGFCLPYQLLGINTCKIKE